MKTLKLAYADFSRSFDPESFFLTRLLRRTYDIYLVEDDADLLVYGVFTNNHKKISAKIKLFYCNENVFPNFSECDYAISAVRLSYANRYFWGFPASQYISAKYYDAKPIDSSLAHRRFCCFIYKNITHGVGAIMRKHFCEYLMKYRHVDCPGLVLHNMNAEELADRTDRNWRLSKQNFISKYKFAIAFENSDGNGYITEKLTDAYLSNVVPIYWGSTMDISPFPKESMIYAPDYPTFEALLQRIKEVDENDDLYLDMLRANPLRNKEFCQQVGDYRHIRDKFILNVVSSLFDESASLEDWRSFMFNPPQVFDFIIPRQPRYISPEE